ncbi:MAG: uridine kinase [Bacteroidales bacterium]|nr:uridine kinase [Bacteroidales bacterium]
MLFIGIAGGSGSGKTTFVEKLIEKISKIDVALLPQDMYYKDHSHLPPEKRKEVNFDHPDAIDFDLLIQHVQELKKGKSVEMPTYSFKTSSRQAEKVKVFPKTIVIIEGILVLTNEGLRNLLDIKIYIDSDPDVRLINILRRDIYEREKNFAEVLKRYETSVKPMHMKFIKPSKLFADFILPHGISLDISTNFVGTMIKNHLLKKMK